MDSASCTVSMASSIARCVSVSRGDRGIGVDEPYLRIYCLTDVNPQVCAWGVCVGGGKGKDDGGGGVVVCVGGVRY